MHGSAETNTFKWINYLIEQLTRVIQLVFIKVFLYRLQYLQVLLREHSV
jgi:hypothetical protein